MGMKYSEYKSSEVEWIGMIPKHWKIEKLGYHISILSGFPFKSELFDPFEGFPILRIRDITSGKCETFYKGEYDKSQIVSNNDLLVGMDGDFTLRWWENGDVLLNQRCCCLKTNNTLLKRFLFYFLPENLKIVNDLTYFTTVKHLSNDDIKRIKISLPPLPEQEEIVKYLDDKTFQIDNLISLTEKKIELLKQKRTSLINEVITRGLDPKVELKDSGIEWIGEIPKHWDKDRIKYIGFMYGGLTGKSGDDFRKDEDDPTNRHFIPFTNICNNTYIDKNDLKLVSINEKDNQNIVKKGDIFFMMTSENQEDLGKTSILKDDLGEVYLNTFCKGFRIKNKSVNPYFLNYLLNSNPYRVILSIEGNGFTRINLRQDRVSDFVVFTPPQSEQEEIVKYLDTHTTEIDNLISIEQRRIETLKEYRQSMISEVITGKLNVN